MWMMAKQYRLLSLLGDANDSTTVRHGDSACASIGKSVLVGFIKTILWAHCALCVAWRTHGARQTADA